MGWLTRLVAALAFLASGVLFSPQTFRSVYDAHISCKLSTYLKLAHLLSFSAAFGTVLWVTFIGGIIMFKNLPRHQFGNLQSKMFPAYFSTVGICCFLRVSTSLEIFILCSKMPAWLLAIFLCIQSCKLFCLYTLDY